jgi:nucleotide-binding universal stress UspA family protein
VRPIAKILVPVDFSEHASAALERAVDLGRRFGARLCLLHAYELPGPAMTEYQISIPEPLAEQVRAAASTRLEALRERVLAEGLDVTCELVRGAAADAVAKLAASLEADLVVMGTRGTTGLQHLLLGSVAERTVRTAPCPVLTVKADAARARKPISRILAATDFSKSSELAFEAAIDWAKRLGAELTLVHALRLQAPLVTPYEVVFPQGLLDQARDAAARRLEKGLEKAKAGGVSAKMQITSAPAVPALAELAEELGADLIVMGTRGHTGLAHVLLGSVAERTLRLAPCAVLTVKGPSK